MCNNKTNAFTMWDEYYVSLNNTSYVEDGKTDALY